MTWEFPAPHIQSKAKIAIRNEIRVANARSDRRCANLGAIWETPQ
jgi:hypothetical protein